MARHDSELELKKLSISLMGEFSNLWRITFFVYPKPKKATHILQVLQWKNDKEYRVQIQINNASDFVSSFSSKEAVRYGIMFHIQMNYQSFGVDFSEHWRGLDTISYTRNELQKFINIQ